MLRLGIGDMQVGSGFTQIHPHLHLIMPQETDMVVILIKLKRTSAWTHLPNVA